MKRLLLFCQRFLLRLEGDLSVWDQYTRLEEESLERKQTYACYAGPRDGEQILYVGLIYRLAAHPDGVYLFNGEFYKWHSACGQSVHNFLPTEGE